jgi:membrane-bound ClpP family serine protease
MVVHSEMVKKIGMFAAIVGVILILLASVLFLPTQGVSVTIPLVGAILMGVILGHIINTGVYFVMFGVVVWIIGAAIEYRANKIGIPEKTVKEEGP